MDAPLLSPPSLLLLQLHTCTHRLNYIRILPSLFSFILFLFSTCESSRSRYTCCGEKTVVFHLFPPISKLRFPVISTQNSSERDHVLGCVFKDFKTAVHSGVIFVIIFAQMFWNPAARDGNFCFISQNTAHSTDLCCKQEQVKVHTINKNF